MPQQLIYTSSPQGLVAGRSGYCTVAHSHGLREALQLSLEQISYYEHLSGTQARQPVVSTHRVIDIRGTRYHVLSHIVDAGLDFTKRTNFIAHHLVFEPQEAANLPAPPVILLLWNGWLSQWLGEPQLLRNENWGNLFELGGQTYNPARNWAALSGDAANAAALLDGRPTESFLADGLEPEQTLGLLAESLALVAVRPALGSPWQQTFTTFLQEQDEPAAFRWRLVYSGTAAHQRLVARGTSLKSLAALRCGAIDELTAAYARSGPQPLVITRQPEDHKLVEGQSLTLQVLARGVPPPSQYQWYTCTRDGRRQPVPGGVNPELVIARPSSGVSRYLVVVGDGRGASVESRVAIIQVDRDFEPPRRGGPLPASRSPAKLALVSADEDELPVKPKGARAWTEADTAADEAWKKANAEEQKKSWSSWLIWAGIIGFFIIFCGLGYGLYHALTGGSANGSSDNATNASPSQVTSNSTTGSNPGPPSASGNSRSLPAAPEQLAQTSALPTNVKLALIMLVNVGPNVDQEALSSLGQELKQKQDSLDQARKNLREEKSKTDQNEETINQRTLEKSQRENDFNEVHSQLNLLQQSYDHQQKLAATELLAKAGNLFKYPATGQIYFQAYEFLSQKALASGSGSGTTSFDVQIDGSEFKLQASTNDFFSLTNIEITKNHLAVPLLIVLSTNAEPGSMPMAKVVLWPMDQKFSATFGAEGSLAVLNGDSLFMAINDLQKLGNYDLDFKVNYSTRINPAYYGTNFDIEPAKNYVFAGLPEKLQSWELELAAITNFTTLETTLRSRVVTTDIWDEVDVICTNLTRATQPYNFRNGYDSASGDVMKVLNDFPNLPLQAALADANLKAIDQFYREEKRAATLGDAKSRLQSLVPFNPSRLEGIIQQKGRDLILARITFQ